MTRFARGPAARGFARCAALSVLALALGAGSVSAALTARAPLPKEPLTVHPQHEQRLVVKFRDEARVRALPSGRLASLSGADVAALNAAADRLTFAFEPLLRTGEAALANLESRAASHSGRAQPDLAGMALVRAEATADRLLEIAAALDADARVEWLSLEALGMPPPTDLAPPTPDLVAGQTYLVGNPGLNSNFAWSRGATGAGIRVSDCEYGWNATHEDLNEIDLHLEPGQTIAPGVYANDWDEHGTAVAGICAGLVNEYGCNGMAPDVEFHTFPEWTVEQGFRRPTCVANAIASSAAGDVVLLEMQTVGPGGDYGPAELDLAVWTVVQVGTSAGVIVVGAAGNGNQNLDSPAYAAYLARGDSGAILVGAGSSSIFHDKLSFSTFGSRVDVQAWGQNVRTLGYGQLAYNGSDQNQWYTNGFNGTSSASALTAPSCALLQSFQMLAVGTPLTPAELRQLLVDTGWPQGTGGHVGPAVNIKKALETQFPAVGVPDGIAAADTPLRVEPNPVRGGAVIRFALPAPAPTDLDVFDASGRRVRRLLASTSSGAGSHTARWDGRDDAGRSVAAGVYFVRLTAGAMRAEQRAVVLR